LSITENNKTNTERIQRNWYSIDTSGKVKHLTRNQKEVTLELLQKEVGGNIQVLNLDYNNLLYLNEDGMNLNMERNYPATALIRLAYPKATQAFLDGYALGTMVVCFEEYSPADRWCREQSGYKNNVEILQGLISKN